MDSQLEELRAAESVNAWGRKVETLPSAIETDCVCKHCQKAFVHRTFLAMYPTANFCPECRNDYTLCPDCKGVHSMRERDCPMCMTKRAQRAFYHTIPPLYRDTDIERLPCREAYDAAMSEDAMFDDDGDETMKGFFFFGPSGTGKTRTVYKVIYRMLDAGETAQVIRGLQFAKDVVRLSTGSESGALDRYISDLTKLDILCMDEVDKFKFTPRVTAEWFDLLERRLERERFTIFISNVPLDKFLAAIDSEKDPKVAGFKEPIERRLREMFKPIRFKKGK